MVWLDVFFFELLTRFFDKYSDLNDNQPSEDEIEAGIDALKDFPTYIGICKPLMERFGQPIEYFLNEWDSETLFMFLLHDWAEDRIRKNLEMIRQENAMFEK